MAFSMSALRGALPCAPAPRVLISSYNGLSLARLPVRIAGGDLAAAQGTVRSPLRLPDAREASIVCGGAPTCGL